MQTFFKTKKILIIFTTLVLVGFFSKIVFAVWDGNFYDPGETLNPECLPTQTDCDVLSPLTSTNISDTAYDATTWNGVTTIAPSKNAVRDKIETLYAQGGTDVAVADGGTGLSAIAALSILAANSANTYVAVTPGAGKSIRINAGGTAWEAYTPTGGTIDGSGTLNELTYWVDGDTIGALAVATYPSLTELTYVKGVTSAIQTQIDTKAPTASPTFTTQIITPLVVGGTATTSDLSFKTTSGVGDTGADMHFLVGNNGATEAMTILNNGNVGIGTTSPDSHLQIEGAMSAASWTTTGIGFDVAAATYTDTSTAAAGTVAVRTANSFGAPTFASTNAITVTDAFTLYVPKPIAGTNTTITRANSAYFEGNVGIGTTTPSAKLNVVGTIDTNTGTTVSSIRFFDNSATPVHKGNITWYDTGRLRIGSANALDFITNDTDTSRLWISTGGLVGIGTTAPDAALEINHATGDSLRLTYNDADGSATNYTDFSLGSTGGLTITGSAASVASATGAEKTFLTLTPATVTLTGTTQVTSLMDTYLLSRATIAGDTATVTVDDAATLTIEGPPAEGTNVSLTEAYGLKINAAATTATTAYGAYIDAPTGAGSNYGLIVNSGNVGIGTTGPAAKLDVASGNVFIDKGYGYAMGDTNDEIRTDDSPAWLSRSNVVTFKVYDAAGAGAWVFRGSASEANKVTILADTGNVGIGETTPTAVLHLKAGTTAASTAPLKFTSGTLNTTAEAGAVEFLTDAFYGTITTAAARKQFAFTDSNITGSAATVTGAAQTAITTLANLVSVGTITTGVWNATDIPVSAGGTGLSSIAALSILAANSADTYVAVTPGAGNSIRINAGGTAWEAYTPSTGTGDVVGPSSATDNAAVRFDSTTGKLVQNSTFIIGDNTTPTTVSTSTGTAASAYISTTPMTGGSTDIATTGTGGAGAAVTFKTGTGGTATAAATSATGGAGGSLTINTGVGGASSVAGTGTNTGGIGGALNIQTSAGGAATGATSGTNTGGVGSAIVLTAGAGGAANSGSGDNVAGAGGAITVTAGTGGVGTTGGTGGLLTLKGGPAGAMEGSTGGGVTLTGGAGSTTGTGGAGGNIAFTGGAAGGDGTVARAGGTVTITAGLAKGAQAGGNLTLAPGAAGTNPATGTATGSNAGTIVFSPVTGGTAPNAEVASTGGVGGAYSFSSGGGGAAAVAGTGTNTGGAGGGFTMSAGTGGAATGASSGTSTGGAGGAFTFTGGTGGAANSGSGTMNGGAGGAASLSGGPGGIGTTSSGAGGTATVKGGTAAAAEGGAGGAVAITGTAGSSTGSGGAGGAVSITAGSAGGDNTVNRAGGTINITAGTSKGDTVGSGINLIGGAGGLGTGVTGAKGGTVTLWPGNGGIGSDTGGVGGDTVIRGGLGGDATTDGVGGAVIFQLAATTSVTEVARITAGGKVSIGIGASPTAMLHIKAGTATANTAPLKFNSGTLLTVPEAGAVEFLTDAFYGTITTGAARKTFAFLESPSFTTPALGVATYTTLSGGSITDSGLTATRVTFAGTAGLLSDDADLTFATDTLSATKLLSSTSVSTPSLISTGAVGITPAAGSNLNVTLSTTGDFAVNTNHLYVDTSLGNVGVGLAAPLLKLDVAGSGRFTGTGTSVLTGSIDPTASTTVTGVNTLFTTELVVGDRITVTGVTKKVTAIASDTSLTVDTAFTDLANDTSPDKLAAIFIARDSSNDVKFLLNDFGMDVGSGGLTHDWGTGITSISSLNTGNFEFDTDAGAVSWADMSVSDTPADNTIESYSAQLDGNAVLTIYGLADSSGGVDNLGVGIGTTTPAGLFHVSSDTVDLGKTYLTQANASADSFDVNFRKARGTGASPTVITTADELGVINFTGYGGAAGYITGAAIKGISSGTIADSRVPGQLSFWTGTDAAPSVSTERMTIDNAGKTGIGDSTPDYGLDVVADINSDDCFREAGVQVAGTCASDEKLKQNIEPLTGSLDKILALNPVSFEWKEDIAQYEGIRYIAGRQVGLIAQEVQTVLPNLVKEKNGFLSIRYNLEMQMMIIASIKELNLKIEGLEGRISALEANVLGAADGGGAGILGQLGQYASDFFNSVLAKVEDGVAYVKGIVADKLTAKEICLEDVCITKSQLKELLEKNDIDSSIPEPEASPESASSPQAEEGAEESAPESEIIAEPETEESATDGASSPQADSTSSPQAVEEPASQPEADQPSAEDSTPESEPEEESPAETVEEAGGTESAPAES